MFWRKPKITKICVIRLSGHGEIIQSSAPVRALRNRFPDAKITFVVAGGFEDAVAYSPVIDNLVVFHNRNDVNGGGDNLINLAYKLFRCRFDLLLDLQNSSQSRFLSFFAFPWRRTPVIGNWSRFSTLEKYQFFLKKAGIEDSFPMIETWPGDDAVSFAEDFLERAGIREDDFFIGLNPGTDWLTKSWPEEFFAQVANYFSLAHGAKAIVFGNPSDRDKALEIYQLMEKKPILAAGRTTFRESEALLSRCKLMITVDSPLLHAARGMKIPTIAIFGGTDSHKQTAPLADFMRVLRDINCQPCHKNHCQFKTRTCLWAITPEIVIEQAESLLGISQFHDDYAEEEILGSNT
jgi:ADP-heptose:LPS heptosyltransferase